MGASWHSRMAPSTTTAVVGKEVKEVKGGEKNENGRGDFDILTTKAAPGVVFEKGMKGKGKGKGIGGGVGAAGAEGGEEEVVEKTLLQKWVLSFFFSFSSSLFLLILWDGFEMGVGLLTRLCDRYWWVLLGVAVLAMAGGGDK